MNTVTVLSNDHDSSIEISHDTTDPGLWIVRRLKKFLWWKRQISSHWFSNEQQALAFARNMKGSL